jgi:hypothetical protein
MTVRACVSCLDSLLEDISRARRAVKGSRSEGEALALEGPRARVIISIQVEAEQMVPLYTVQSEASECESFTVKGCERQHRVNTWLNLFQ